MLEKAKEAPDGNDATKGIALNTMVFFYLQPDFKFDIVGNHDTVFSKARACHVMQDRCSFQCLFNAFSILFTSSCEVKMAKRALRLLRPQRGWLVGLRGGGYVEEDHGGSVLRGGLSGDE